MGASHNSACCFRVAVSAPTTRQRKNTGRPETSLFFCLSKARNQLIAGIALRSRFNVTPKNRYLIVSFPKAGTHFLHSVLNAALGREQQMFIHYEDHTQQYRASLITEEFAGNRDKWINFGDNLPFAFYTGRRFTDPELLLYLVREGEVVMSHLTRRQIPFHLDRAFYYIFLVRNIEGIIASAINTEIKIAHFDSSLLDAIFLDVDLTALDVQDLPGIITKYFDILVPYFLDMLYWQYSNRAILIQYQDVMNCSPAMVRLLTDVTGEALSQQQIDGFYKVASSNQSTKLTSEDKIVSEAMVRGILGNNKIFHHLNAQINFLFINSKII